MKTEKISRKLKFELNQYFRAKLYRNIPLRKAIENITGFKKDYVKDLIDYEKLNVCRDSERYIQILASINIAENNPSRSVSFWRSKFKDECLKLEDEYEYLKKYEEPEDLSTPLMYMDFRCIKTSNIRAALSGMGCSVAGDVLKLTKMQIADYPFATPLVKTRIHDYIDHQKKIKLLQAKHESEIQAIDEKITKTLVSSMSKVVPMTKAKKEEIANSNQPILHVDAILLAVVDMLNKLIVALKDKKAI